jgi:lysophospholipase L1-like esterase
MVLHQVAHLLLRYKVGFLCSDILLMTTFINLRTEPQVKAWLPNENLYRDAANIVSSTNSSNGRFSPVASAFNLNHLGNSNYLSGTVCNTSLVLMPLGDSITRGDGTGTNPFKINNLDDYRSFLRNSSGLDDTYGYRYYLYNLLETADYDFDFVGGLQHGASSGLTFDYDHEGHGGFRADQIATNVNGYLGANPAPVVLLHIGTNDIAQDQGDSADDVETILDAIDNFDEEITVIIAQIIDQNPDNPDYQSVTVFNNNVETLVQDRITNGDKLILVDMENALTYPDDMFDWLHPNDAGYQKMADVWFAALEEFMSICPPTITSTPTTAALVGELYSYDVEATGMPEPTFEFTATPPNGMTIDETTGVISWTPSANQEGDHNVTVQATNVAGSDTQAFTVTVNSTGICLVEPISYWRLDALVGGIAAIDSIQDNDGVCSSNCPQVANGLVNAGFDFDGSDEVDVTDHPSLDWGPDDSFTIQTWVNTTQVCGGNKVFLGKFRGGTNQRGDWWLGCGDDTNASNVATFWLREGGGGTGQNNIQLKGSTTLNDGAWHHVSASYDGTSNIARLYVDGRLEATQSQAFSFTLANDEPLNIGHFISAYHFDGRLDEIIIHDNALSTNEVWQHYINGTGGVGYCAATVVAPEIISTPVTTAATGSIYTYMVQATGIPAPTYALLTSPPGMTIDINTGAISWTPNESQTGSHAVTVQASNGNNTEQSFMIEVTAPLPTYLPFVTK